MTATRRVPGPMLASVSLAVLGATIWLLLQPHTPDMAAQVFRAQSFADNGSQIWNNQWYGGHYLPSYSIVSPALGGLLGAWWAGAVAAVLAAAAVSLVVKSATPDRGGRMAGCLLGSSAVLAAMTCGRTTYLLGIAVGATSLALLNSNRPNWSWGPLALLTPLASPVAGAFLGICGVARRDLRGASMAGLALIPIALLGWLFPDGGTQPFTWKAFWPVVVACVVALWLVPKDWPSLRLGALLYLIATVAVFVLPTPVGSNITRLGQLAAGPIAAVVLLPAGRKSAFLILLPFIIVWQWTAPVLDISKTVGERSVQQAFYSPLIAKIREQGGPPGRLEVVWTRGHWEAAWVARTIPLARGWERQLDRRFNSSVNGPDVSPAAYRAWLDGLGVRWVALPNAPLDSSVSGEAKLVRGGLRWLKPIWKTKDWKLYAVAKPQPVALNYARQRGDKAIRVKVIALSPESIRLVVEQPTPSDPGMRGTRFGVRVRWSPWWQLKGASACITRTTRADGWPQGMVSVTPVEPLASGQHLTLVMNRSPLHALRDPGCAELGQ